MPWPCPDCHHPQPSFLGALLHCDPVEPIDDLDEP